MRNDNNKMLFFRTQADEADVNGIDDQVCLPASRLVSMQPGSATTIEMLFRSVKNNDLAHNDQLPHDKVVLTVTQGDIQEVLAALVQKINSNPHSDGFIVIADDTTTKDGASGVAWDDQAISAQYAHPSIIGVASITVANFLARTQQPSLGTGNATMTAISDGLALSVNTHYKSIATDADVTIPSAILGRAGDWITVTYTTIITGGQAHTYTTTTDTTFAAGSVLIGLPGADDSDGTRVGRVQESDGSAKDVITITGLAHGDCGIGTTLKFVNVTGTTNGWAVEGQITHQGDGDIASAFTFS